MKRRVVILTEIISPYRIPVFNAIAKHEEVSLHVIFLAETDPTLRQWRIYKDEIRFSYQVLSSWRWRTKRSTLLLNRGLWAELETARPEVIICGGYNYLASWEALWWAHRRRAKFILWSESTANEHENRHAWADILKRLLLRHCDAFLVPGKSAGAYLQDLGAPPQKIFTASNAVDNAFFSSMAGTAKNQAAAYRQRLGLPERYILYAGRLVPEKGVFDLLDAYAKLETTLRSKIGLLFVGDGPLRGGLVERSRQLHSGTVIFLGFVQREDLAVVYSLAEVLALPSHREVWGLVVNEGMVCGLPIVATSVAGCAQDLVEDGWNGRVVPPRNPDRLSSALRSIIVDPEMRSRMSANSLERIQRFSPADCAGGFVEAVTSLRTNNS